MKKEWESENKKWSITVIPSNRIDWCIYVFIYKKTEKKSTHMLVTFWTNKDAEFKKIVNEHLYNNMPIYAKEKVLELVLETVNEINKGGF